MPIQAESPETKPHTDRKGKDTTTGKYLIALLALLVLTTIGPPAQAGDSFWHGTDLSDSGPTGLIPYGHQQALHEYLAEIIPSWGDNGGVVRMPSGDMILDGDRGVRIHKPRKCWSGYTLLNSLPSTGTAKNGNTVLIDMKGNIVNEWVYPGPAFASASKMLPGGHVVGSSFFGGFTQMDWNGNVIKKWPTLKVHHDHERQGNPCGYFAPYQKPMTIGGNLLTLESDKVMDDPTICERIPIQGDLIRELTWDGTELFAWRANDYIDDLGLDEGARNAIHLGHNGGGGPPGGDHNNYTVEDWSHGNAVAWLGPNKWWSQHYDGRFHPQNIIADFRSLNVTIIIARHKHPYGKWAEGDIIWKLGPDYSDAGDDGKVGQIIGQHMAHMVPMYMPGEGNILMFDNGGGAGYGGLLQGLRDDDGKALDFWPNKFRRFSRVLEINPITKQIEWEYKQPKPTKDLNGDGKKRGNERLFYSNIMSGAQRLMNGNTLITEADTGRVLEVTRKGEVVWEYAPPWANPKLGIFGSGIYRAYRVPSWWVPRHLLYQKNGSQ